tara:strand:- start:173 stop:1234 length:1062 start_codon:yes stop_codon:yes gene_type:complete
MVNMSVPAVDITGVYKGFGAEPVVNGATFSVEKGEILVLLGPSGCGKTTTLRLIAGFEKPDKGTVSISGRTVVDNDVFVQPEKRHVGMVFQDYALFPHLSVADNVAYGVDTKRYGIQSVLRALTMTRLNTYQYRFPHELSGGQQQRVALARALAPRPEVILLDEPFSNLDSTLREGMRKETKATIKDSGTTAIFVTHSQEEALFMGDKIAVMNQGIIEQIGTPDNIFNSPSNEFVANFMDAAEFLPVKISSGEFLTEIGNVNVANPPSTDVEDLSVMVRAHDIVIEPSDKPIGAIQESVFQGATVLYSVLLESGQIVHSMMPHVNQYEKGTKVKVTLAPGHNLNCFSRGKRLS